MGQRGGLLAEMCDVLSRNYVISPQTAASGEIIQYS